MVNTKNLKNQKGFTLIEILVVIGIIAVLATIVLIAINPARQFAQSRDTQRTSNVNAILNAVGQYIADNKGDLPAGVPDKGDPAVDIPQSLCEALVPTYMPSLPTDPNSFFDGGSLIKVGGVDDGCEDLATEASGYLVSQDNDGRITLSAIGEITTPIEVTR